MNIQARGTSQMWRTQICHHAAVTLNSRARGRAHACASHFMMRPWRAQLLECAQAVRSRAAFKRTLDSVRKRMLGCTRDADVAGGGVSAARLNHAPNTTHRAQLWHLYIAQGIFASRAYLAEDSAPSVASPSTRYEHSRLLGKSSCAQGRQPHIDTTAVFHVFEYADTNSRLQR